jgi:transcriptional regulator of acetoin/glycerol metabolism
MLPDEKTALIDALVTCRGNQSQAARYARRESCYRLDRIKKYGIDIKELMTL